MNDLVEQHLAYLEAEHTSHNSIASRRRVLKSLAQIADPATATREHVEQWWSLRRDLSPATRANDLAGVRGFYKWAQIWEHRADDPSLRLKSPKINAGLPRPIARADLLLLLDELPADLRRAVCLGAYAGLRVAEVAALRWGDVDCEARRARIQGKGGKWRLVALSPLLLDSIRPELEDDTNVVTQRSDAFAAGQLDRRVNRAMQALGVDATFHQLRHRYGTLAYQATGDLIAVGRQMGHDSPVTTAIYAAASDETADKIAEAVSR